MTIIKLDHITKIEGHAKLVVKIRDNKVKEASLYVTEGSRFFEKLVKGRSYQETSSIVSRICGVCSTSHSLCALLAIEKAMDVKVTKQTKVLRALMHHGTMLSDHVLHGYFLALPDYMGYESAIAMASDHKEEVLRALRLKRLGNDVIRFVGRRAVHQITAVLGGFSQIPDENQIPKLVQRLKAAKKDIMHMAKLFGKLKYPNYTNESQYFALKGAEGYQLLEGDVNCTGKMCIPTIDYDKHFKEYFNPKSTAKFVQLKGRSYMVGALARINNNFAFLTDNAKKVVKESGIKFPNHSPFINNFAQAVETVHCYDKALEILESLKLKEEEPVKFNMKAGRGVAALEAPRGILFHDYTIKKDGKVEKANIIPPTTQNLFNIENDIKAYLPILLKKNLSEDAIKLELEKLIRAYDPCISCSAHFLELEIKRE